ncbi:MAG TPA: ABC transporter ATP-binding protein [Pyrinomonadaceae bacterium]|nr:ABC transporter ATP-binding protein [Pyrinomonadaceae bacterium]
MKPIVRLEQVSKQYRLGTRGAAYETLRESLVEAIRAPFRRLRSRNGGVNSGTIWALKDIGFDVAPGEVIGIIGRNGAGKSTLLKVLSRITEPTSGRIELYGRVASLLEVGTGFHPELTGRENIFLNGAILGMKRSEIDDRFDEIVAFSELEKFLDTPVKRYSSGMYMRLAFAVASHMDPEILVVDEVLAVGDAQFQKKCLGKMTDVSREGRTVLFVSHNMTAVQSLCGRAVWLDQGIIVKEGPPTEVVANYLKHSLSTMQQRLWDDASTAPGNDRVRIRRGAVSAMSDNGETTIRVSTPIKMEFEYWNLNPGAHLNISVVVSTEEGYPIFNTGPGREPVWHGKPFPGGLFRSVFYIPGNFLNDGTHRVRLYVVKDQATVIYHHDDILTFNVEDDVDGRGAWYGKWIGAVRPDFKWETELLQEGEPARSSQ